MAIPTGSDRFHPSPDEQDEIEQQGTEDAYGDYSGPASAVEEAASLQDKFTSTTSPDDDDDDDDDRDRDRPTGQRYPDGAGGASQPVQEPTTEEEDDREQDQEPTGRAAVADRRESPVSAVIAAQIAQDRFEGGAEDASRASIAEERRSPASAVMDARDVQDEFRHRYESQTSRTGQGLEVIGADDPNFDREIHEAAVAFERELVESGQVASVDDVGIFYDAARGELVAIESEIGEEKRRRTAEDQAAVALEGQLEEQLGIDVEPGVDFSVVETATGYRAEPKEALIERLASIDARARAGSGFTPDAGRAETPADRLDARIEEELGVDLDRGEDYTIEETINEEGETVLVPEFTRAGLRKASGDEFEREIHGPFELLPTVDEEDATLEDVLGGTREEYRKGADALAEVTDVINPFALAERTVRLAEERGPLGFTGYDVLRAEDEEGPIERQSEELAEEVYSIPSYLLGLPAAAEELREVGLETTEVARDEGLGVRADVVDARIRPGPSTAPRAVDVGLEGEGAAPFVVEESEEYTRQTIEGLEEEASTPEGRARLAGSLIGTAFLFGGAAALSTRAGAATRWAIQPGEELATSTLTRAAPGIARRFPNNRIDNEEIVLVGIARGARAARTRARAIREGYSIDVTPRYGAGLVPPKVEIRRSELQEEAERPTITAEDIDSPLGRPRQESLVSRRRDYDVYENPFRERARRGLRRDIESIRAEQEAEEELERLRLASELVVDEGLASRLSPQVTAGAAERLGAATERAIESETVLDLEAEQELATEALLDLEAEAEAEAEAELELELEFEAEAEAEAEAEQELELEVETEPFPPRRKRPREPFPEVEPFAELVTGGDRDLVPGWLRETAADIALGPLATTRLPETAELRAVATEEELATGELPTYPELFGTEGEREAVLEAREFLTPGGGFDLEGAGLDLDVGELDLDRRWF